MAKRRISKVSKHRLMIFGMASVLAIGIFFVTLGTYVYNYISLKNEEKNLQAELLFLQEEKANLKIEIQKLNDPSYVARYAKEKYLFSSDGEYVIKIDTNEKEEITEQRSNNSFYIIIASVIIFLLIILVIRKKRKLLTKNQ